MSATGDQAEVRAAIARVEEAQKILDQIERATEDTDPALLANLFERAADLLDGLGSGLEQRLRTNAKIMLLNAKVDERLNAGDGMGAAIALELAGRLRLETRGPDSGAQRRIDFAVEMQHAFAALASISSPGGRG